jgi:hypothetical protein
LFDGDECTIYDTKLIVAKVTTSQNKAVWLLRIMADLYKRIEEPTVVCCDNMSAIAMTKSHFSSKNKSHRAQEPFNQKTG